MFNIHNLQPDVWSRLTKIISSKRVGSAYLFSGPEGAGKEAAALAFSAALNCSGSTDLCGECTSCIRFSSLQHEHMHIIVPLPRKKDTVEKDTDVLTIIGDKNAALLTEQILEKSKDPFRKIALPQAKRILINSIRELRKKLYLRSVDHGYKTVMIFDAHLLSEGQGETANALLKILEEPPEKTTIILVTDHKPLLLSTIQSRCQQIDFPPLSHSPINEQLQQKGVDQNTAMFFSYLSDGNMHRARSLVDRSGEDVITIMKEQVEAVSNDNSSDWRNYINKMSQLVRSDQSEFKFQLFLLQTWFQQSYRIRTELNSPLAQNGFADSLNSFSNSYPNADLKEINAIIEETINSVNRNFYMPLTLTNMLISIRKHLSG